MNFIDQKLKEFYDKYHVDSIGEFSEQLIPNSNKKEPVIDFLSTLLIEAYEKGQSDAFDGKIQTFNTIEIKEMVHVSAELKQHIISEYNKTVVKMVERAETYELKYPDSWNMIGRTHALIRKENLLELLKDI